jgi:hypothetical protein
MLPCACCPRGCWLGARSSVRFRLTGPSGRLVARCAWCALHYWPVVRRGLLAAGAVGVLLLAVNPGPRVLRTGLPSSVAARSLLTFVICYGVSVFSALAAARARLSRTRSPLQNDCPTEELPQKARPGAQSAGAGESLLDDTGCRWAQISMPQEGEGNHEQCLPPQRE